MKTGPGSRAAQASWDWPGPPGVAADLQSVDLRLLELVGQQVLERMLLDQGEELQELLFLNLDI